MMDDESRAVSPNDDGTGGGGGNKRKRGRGVNSMFASEDQKHRRLEKNR